MEAGNFVLLLDVCELDGVTNTPGIHFHRISQVALRSVLAKRDLIRNEGKLFAFGISHLIQFIIWRITVRS
jgi:hypothetical protein